MIAAVGKAVFPHEIKRRSGQVFPTKHKVRAKLIEIKIGRSKRICIAVFRNLITVAGLCYFAGGKLMKTLAVLPCVCLCVAFKIAVRCCGGKRRTVKLNGNIRGAEISDYRFTGTFEKETLPFRDRAWFDINQLGVTIDLKENLSYHQSRHSFGTLAISAGLFIESIAKMMGHANISTTQGYAQITDMKISEEMDKLMVRRNAANQ